MTRLLVLRPTACPKRGWYPSTRTSKVCAHQRLIAPQLNLPLQFLKFGQAAALFFFRHGIPLLLAAVYSAAVKT